MITAVTGATGHVGASLVRGLLDDGRTVRAINRRPSASLAGLDVEFVVADVLDRVALQRALRGVDVVYHLAGLISISGDPDGHVRATNVDGVRNAATAALDAGVRRFVHCSSIHAFDLEQPGVLTETSPRAVARQLPAYDRSKAAGEVEVRRVVDQGLDAVITNLTGVLGPNDFTPSRMGAVFLALVRRRIPALVAGGFDWVDVRDATAGMMAAEARVALVRTTSSPGTGTRSWPSPRSRSRQRACAPRGWRRRCGWPGQRRRPGSGGHIGGGPSRSSLRSRSTPCGPIPR